MEFLKAKRDVDLDARTRPEGRTPLMVSPLQALARPRSHDGRLR
jgi:hypothetical protein